MTFRWWTSLECQNSQSLSFSKTLPKIDSSRCTCQTWRTLMGRSSLRSAGSTSLMWSIRSNPSSLQRTSKGWCRHARKYTPRRPRATSMLTAASTIWLLEVSSSARVRSPSLYRIACRFKRKGSSSVECFYAWQEEKEAGENCPVVGVTFQIVGSLIATGRIEEQRP